LYTAARAAAEVASARAAAGFPGGCETGPGGLYASWEGDGGAGQYSLNFRHAEFSFRDLGGGFVSMDVYSCA
jgi:hypothetical protein